jgi:heme/copper-type cytochrome/quinol oxidase subunit 2
MRFGRKLAFLLMCGALWTAPAFAQGCAMCRANAKATPKEAQSAINRAILLMIMPPIGAVTFGTTLIVRYARRRDEENERISSESEIDVTVR